MTLFFVTDRADAHVARFDALFQSLTSDYELVQLANGDDGQPKATVSGAHCESWDALRTALSAEGAMVVSGPLDSVSSQLGSGDFAHLGISFATDVMVSAAQGGHQLHRLQTLMSSIDGVVTDNYATENALIAVGVAPEKILRIPWGPDSVNAQRPMMRSECGWPEDRRIVLYPRSLEPHYDPLVFIEALAELVKRVPDVLAICVEGGSVTAQVKEEIARRGLTAYVHFEPLREPDEFRSLMGCADLVVVTPRTDGTSVTVMDAMALGIPVVSSLTAGSAEWVVEGITGWTFPVGDASALALAMERALLSDKAHRGQIIDGARKLVAEKAGWDSSAERLSAVIHSLMPRH